MKNIYPKILLEKVLEKYQPLRKDLHYREGYVMLKLARTMFIYGAATSSLNEKELEELQVMDFEIKQDFQTYWGISIPLEPDLKIEKKDLASPSIKPNSPLAKLIYAYGLSHDSKLITTSRAKKNKVSDFRTRLETRTLKMLVYMLCTKAKWSYRQLGRHFNKDKDTIKAWVDEIDAFPQPEKDALVTELLTSKPLADTDVYDLGPYKISPLKEGGDYKVTDAGEYTEYNDEEGSGSDE